MSEQDTNRVRNDDATGGEGPPVERSDTGGHSPPVALGNRCSDQKRLQQPLIF